MNEPIMTLRDYFAGLAMQELMRLYQKGGDNDMFDKDIAMLAYMMADDMIDVRNEACN